MFSQRPCWWSQKKIFGRCRVLAICGSVSKGYSFSLSFESGSPRPCYIVRDTEAQNIHNSLKKGAMLELRGMVCPHHRE